MRKIKYIMRVSCTRELEMFGITIEVIVEFTLTLITRHLFIHG